MEMILPLFLFIILLNCVTKSGFRKGVQTTLFGMACGAFIVVSDPYAAIETTPQLTSILSDTPIVQEAVTINGEVSHLAQPSATNVESVLSVFLLLCGALLLSLLLGKLKDQLRNSVIKKQPIP